MRAPGHRVQEFDRAGKSDVLSIKASRFSTYEMREESENVGVAVAGHQPQELVAGSGVGNAAENIVGSIECRNARATDGIEKAADRSDAGLRPAELNSNRAIEKRDEPLRIGEVGIAPSLTMNVCGDDGSNFSATNRAAR